jgi:hypothetical protein
MKASYTIVGIPYSSLASTLVLKSDMTLLLVREPDNPHDKNAVRAYIDVGYIKATQAKGLAARLDAGMQALEEGKITSVSAQIVNIEVDEENTDA